MAAPTSSGQTIPERVHELEETIARLEQSIELLTNLQLAQTGRIDCVARLFDEIAAQCGSPLPPLSAPADCPPRA